MSARVHLHVHAADLGKSRDFYARFFGAAPVKEKAGYVKFLPGWAPVNLALSTGRATGEAWWITWASSWTRRRVSSSIWRA